MNRPTTIPTGIRAYPFPWTLPIQRGEREKTGRVGQDSRGSPMECQRARECLELWLQEFRDDRTGGYAPPPMS